MNPSLSSLPTGHKAGWAPDMLNFAIQELRNEYPKTAGALIANAVTLAARQVSPEKGRVALHQRARNQLRR